MSKADRTTQLIHLPSPNLASDAMEFTIVISGETAKLLSSSSSNSMRNLLIKSSEPITYRDPRKVYEDIDIQEWKNSLKYNDTQINNIVEEILLEFGLDTSNENVEFVNKEIDEIISLYERKYGVSLDSDMR